MENSKIEWTHHTFNPWRGCTKVSPGCANCYAETQSHRNPGTLGVWGPGGTRVVASEKQWREPLKWNRLVSCNVAHGGPRPRVFCASLADVFEDWDDCMVDARGEAIILSNGDGPLGVEIAKGMIVPRYATMQHIREALFRLIDDTPNLDWLLLTKRPENISRMTPLQKWADCDHPRASCQEVGCTERIRPNVWIGTSVENQATAIKRIPHLVGVPATVRFLSMEPLLGPIDLAGLLDGIHWVIVGGESGPRSRPCDLDWVRGVVRQCEAAGVPCFVKQLGARPSIYNGSVGSGPHDAEGNSRCWHCGHWDFGPTAAGLLLCNGCDAPQDRLVDPKGGDPNEWPPELRVRQFPTAGKAVAS